MAAFRAFSLQAVDWGIRAIHFLFDTVAARLLEMTIVGRGVLLIGLVTFVVIIGTLGAQSTVLALLLGGWITWFCSWLYYRKAADDLVAEVLRLKGRVDHLLHVLLSDEEQKAALRDRLERSEGATLVRAPDRETYSATMSPQPFQEQHQDASDLDSPLLWPDYRRGAEVSETRDGQRNGYD